ncbi:MAG: SusC/RagA family TonB-linked outer membrane protein [Fodinibius sp.]|nr:SusC/RagA family TonB-linked outer membrane protein [Fodinibius sp.]
MGWCLLIQPGSYAQDVEEVLTLNDQSSEVEQTISLKESLQRLEDKYNVSFIYESHLVEGKIVSQNDLKAASLQKVFARLLEVSNLTYEQIGRRSFLLSANTVASQKAAEATVTGTVTDGSTGNTLPGVNILVKGTSRGTSTGSDGKFELTVPTLQDTLVFSYIGYRTEEIPINGRTTLDISLQQQAVAGEEIVVIGYGTQQKKNVSGSISSVSSDDLEEAPVQRLDDALQGRLSGVRVTSSSGAPGASSSVRIRGTTSINNSQPLYIVDGVPVDNGGIGYLNPSDIESIQVLKDAASAAIYGTRAASGVVLVTTKDGSQGDFEVNYSSYFGIQEPEQKLDLLNAREYATLRNESSVAAGNGIIFPNPQSYGEGTDWQETIFNNSAAVLNQNLSFSGGNENSSYFASVGYYDQEGIVATPISHNRKYSFRINSTVDVTDWLTFSENFSYTYERNRGSLATNSEFGGPLSSAINLDPITPVLITDESTINSPPYSNQPVIRNEQGFPYGISQYVGQEMSNPLAYIETRRGNYGYSHNIVGNASLEIEPIKNLLIKTDIGLKPAFYGFEAFTPIYYLSVVDQNTGSNSFTRENSRNLLWSWDNTINYVTSFDSHNFNFLVGTSTRENSATIVGGTYQAIPAQNFGNASMNFSVPNDRRIAFGGEAQPYALNSYFGRINYDYEGKYLLTAVLRVDGSSRFGSENQYGTFPAVSAGWVPTSENFFPDNFVDYLKLRASYGINGNDRSLGDFQYQSTVSGGRNYVFGPAGNIFTGSSPNAPANPELEWEETTQINVGFDAIFLSDFSVTLDYYHKETNGMLLQVQIPSYVGASGNPFGNVASLTNDGVELELGYNKQFDDYGFNITANGSYNKNEITDIGENDFLTGSTLQASAYEITRTEVGEPINSFYGFKTQGIFQTQQEVNNYTDSDGNLIQPNAQPGDFRWKDVNGDGQITSEDRTFLGNPTPPWTFGINLSANWKQFDVKMFGQGVYGNEIFQGLRRLDITSANYTSRALNRWTGPGTSNSYPRLSDNDPNNNFTNPSDFHLSDGSYFRIKTLQFGYTLPTELSTELGIQQARFYIRGENLATITGYTGFDPEVGGDSFGIDRGIYPQARSYQLGVNIRF